MKKSWWEKLGWFFKIRLHGKEGLMAKLIEFYIPENYRKQTRAWTPAESRGKVIVFSPGPHRKSA